MSANLSLGLIGWPLEHSLSPQMHNAALRDLNVQGSYHLFAIPPQEAEMKISSLLAEMKSGGLQGLNVTIPYKWEIQNLVDDRSIVVETIRAANTLYYRNGKLHAENTDVPGLRSSLLNSHLQNGSGPVLILGAGGAARAAVYVAYELNRPVILAARRIEQAQNLASELSRKIALSIETIQLTAEDLGRFSNIDLVLNTTPVGMWPHSNAMPWPDNLQFPAAGLLDMIYNPPVTKFIRFARDSGAQALNGLDMLVEQAALSLELWSGQAVSRPVMKQAALDELGGRYYDVNPVD